MKANPLARFAPLLALAALAAGCVEVEPQYERRTSVWVSDSTSSGYTENDARRALVLPADVLPPGEPVAASISFGGAGLSREAREDPHVRPLAVGGLVAREKPWLLGNAEDDDEAASGENLLYLRGCMDRRKWTSRSVWPDPHMSLFLDRLRALCSQLCGE